MHILLLLVNIIYRTLNHTEACKELTVFIIFNNLHELKRRDYLLQHPHKLSSIAHSINFSASTFKLIAIMVWFEHLPTPFVFFSFFIINLPSSR